jgi:hypothetical protein
MNKEEVSKRVLKNGNPLSLDLFSWDEKTNTFSSNEDNLVIDFNCISGCSFKTGNGCTFNTGSDCTFNTRYECTFDTGSDCTFNTGSDCTFKTGSRCTFDAGCECTFKTGKECVLVRRDIYEVIELPESKEIKLNAWGIKGYTEVKDQIEMIVKINGKEVSLKDISEETLLNIRNNS